MYKRQVVVCQLHPLGDSRITVTEHLHIELHITVKDVLNPFILYIELQADVGNLVIPVSYTHLAI